MSAAPHTSEHAEKTTKALALGIIQRVIWLRDCRQETLSAMVECGVIRHYGKGERVAQCDEPFDFLGLLVKGSLEASLTRAWGHRHLVGLMQPGDLVGLVPALDGLGHVNDLWSRGPATLLLVPGDDLRRLRDADTMLVRALEQHLAFRCRVLFERLVADPGLSLEGRLCSLLLTLGTLYGVPRGNGFELEMKLSQSDMADWLGVSRQRINFVVKRLEADGLLDARYQAVQIVDRAKLVERANKPFSPDAVAKPLS
ncbi:Crp/Fnr family transcriptional regulator [Paraburkholderia acidiphila]|uniref:Helix-turn-helix domain-containing protein n=1 Tax=Paraburkholderia acidiphila TaxID=2571747 RepID=A0A7Z2JAB8_9BURK|nr:Crp/Fnr family transcriptional regulator [Paraburkholderia acidiphila]QGZ57727.1 helix-turn-helix domain-containing protein [Paraburkholderia acidiphila]